MKLKMYIGQFKKYNKIWKTLRDSTNENSGPKIISILGFDDMIIFLKLVKKNVIRLWNIKLYFRSTVTKALYR